MKCCSVLHEDVLFIIVASAKRTSFETIRIKVSGGYIMFQRDPESRQKKNLTRVVCVFPRLVPISFLHVFLICRTF